MGSEMPPRSQGGSLHATSTPAIYRQRLPRWARWARRATLAFPILAGLLATLYASLSAYVAAQLVYREPLPITTTPAAFGLAYADVTFPARDDGVLLKGWFIPGVLPSGALTARDTLVMVHGAWQNRTDPAAGLLDLSAALARRGFAILAFDMRGMGESSPAPFSLGYFEQRDVLGALDFLASGQLPYPDLGRPVAIGAWGVSMGAIALLLAAARDTRIQAVVADSAYPDIIPLLERELPKAMGLPAAFTHGALRAAHVLYGIDCYALRPVDVVARIAPRPLFFIQGAADTYNPPSNLAVLVAAAQNALGARVQSWMTPGAGHAQAFHTAGADYVDRVAAFYQAAATARVYSPAPAPMIHRP